MADAKKDVPVDVAGVMENAFMMGIGALELTREKVTALTDELMERGRMSQSEARKVAERVTEAAGKQQESLRKTVAEETQRAMQAAGVVTRDEMDALRREIAELKTLLVGRREAEEPSAG